MTNYPINQIKVLPEKWISFSPILKWHILFQYQNALEASLNCVGFLHEMLNVCSGTTRLQVSYPCRFQVTFINHLPPSLIVDRSSHVDYYNRGL